MVLCLRDVECICFFDLESDHLLDACDESPNSLEPNLGFKIRLSNTVLTLTVHKDGLTIVNGSSHYFCVERMKNISITDNDTSSVLNMSKFEVGSMKNSCKTWVISNWGFENSTVPRNNMFSQLSFPLQFSTVLTSNNWCRVNIGFQDSYAEFQDLSLLWAAMEFFGSYFQSEEFGHPGFGYERIQTQDDKPDLQCMNLDVRSWFESPRLYIPCADGKNNDSRIGDRNKCMYVSIICPQDAGIFYRYTSVGMTYSNQEICAKDLSAAVLPIIILKGVPNHSKNIDEKDLIISNLRFLLQYGFDTDLRHMTLSCKCPLPEEYFSKNAMNEDTMCKFKQVLPVSFPKGFILDEPIQMKRNLGSQSLNIKLDIDSLSYLITSLTNLLHSSNDNDTSSELQSEMDQTLTAEYSRVELTTEECTYSSDVTLDFSDVRAIISDPVLRMHRPILIVCCRMIKFTALDFQSSKSHKTGLQYTCEAQCYIDYFNNFLKCWEPFIEPFQFNSLLESNSNRGDGVVLRSIQPLRTNVTYGLLESLNEAVKSYFNIQKLNEDRANTEAMKESSRIDIEHVNNEELLDSSLTEYLEKEKHFRKCLIHEHDRVAFSLKNETGERVRYHQRTPQCQTDVLKFTCVENGDRVQLEFEPIQTVVSNLTVVERPMMFSGDDKLPFDTKRRGHKIDIQIAGYKFIPNVPLDRLGSWYEDIVPISDNLRSKIDSDWRMRNVAGKLLVRVAPSNGGRQVVLKSVFKVINRTSHNINLALNTGSNAKSVDTNQISVDEAFDIPLSILTQSLQNCENSLGGLWLNPNLGNGKTKVLENIFSQNDLDFEAQGTWLREINKSPIELLSLVNNSELLYQHRKAGKQIPQTGTCFSCPISCSNDRALPPFCYVVEISRKLLASVSGGIQENRRKAKKESNIEFHPPISYTLTIYPPILLENLLPKRGIFSLFSENLLVWSKEMEPGEKVAIHTVGKFLCRSNLSYCLRFTIFWVLGLDELLYLHIKIGSCQTPYGEYALVHDGIDNTFSCQTHGKSKIF